MIRFGSLFGLAIVVSAIACGGSNEGGSASDSNDELRARAKKPIEQVAQYAGTFEALDVKHGNLELKADGTFVWEKGELNARQTGNYTGPTQPVEHLGPTLKIKTEQFEAVLAEGEWTADQGAPETLKLTTKVGEVVEFESTYRLGGEAECDDTGGHYTDDDPDPATGLNCVCDAPKVFRHANGGCK